MSQLSQTHKMAIYFACLEAYKQLVLLFLAFEPIVESPWTTIRSTFLNWKVEMRGIDNTHKIKIFKVFMSIREAGASKWSQENILIFRRSYQGCFWNMVWQFCFAKTEGWVKLCSSLTQVKFQNMRTRVPNMSSCKTRNPVSPPTDHPWVSARMTKLGKPCFIRLIVLDIEPKAQFNSLH